jgi:predicted Zn-dependent peptidase
MKKLLLIALVLGFVIPSKAQINRTAIPEAGPMPSIQLKKPEQFQLKNGLHVLIVENHKLPRVSIQLSIDTPPILEGDKVGTSSLLSAMLGKGSASISKDEFIEEVDFLGAQLNFGALSAYGQSLSKVYPRIMELMAEGALNPSFDAAEFEKEKEKIITGLKSNEKSVEAIASRIQRAVAYGNDHPYGEFETPESIEGISIDDVTKFYEEHFVPNNAYLVILGDVELKEAKKISQKTIWQLEKSGCSGFLPTKSKNLG